MMAITLPKFKIAQCSCLSPYIVLQHEKYFLYIQLCIVSKMALDLF